MFRKVFVFILFTVVAGTAAYGQKKVTTTGKGQSAAGVFAYSFGGGSYLGIQIDEVTKENMAQYGLKEVRGVAIEKVLDDSPAQAAGLQNGDVIVKFNGEDVTSERKLIRLLSEVAPDHEAKVKVLRNGDEREITVTVGKSPGIRFANGELATTLQSRLEKMPPMPAMPVMPEWKAGELTTRAFAFAGSGRYIGASLMSLTKQLGEVFGVADGKGMLITEVRENTPAAKAGLKAGDVIVEVDGKEVSPENSLFTVLHDKKEGDITLTVVRDRNRQTFTVTPEVRKGGSVGELFEGFAPGQFTVATPMIAPAAIAPFKITTAPMAPMAPMQVLLPGRVL